MNRPDVFPTTRQTWIGDQLARGDVGRDAVVRHIMQIYANPLEVYIRRFCPAAVGSPMEVVQGFFASRLERADYLLEWQHRGGTLRCWLKNGISFYIKELRARNDRNQQFDPLPPVLADSNGLDPGRQYERAVVIEMVRRALVCAEECCNQAGLELNWKCFYLHHLDELPYQEVGERLGISQTQAKEWARAARVRFRQAVRELFVRDGTSTGELDNEIAARLEDLT